MALLVLVANSSTTPIPQELAALVGPAALQPIFAMLAATLDVAFLVRLGRRGRNWLAVLLPDIARKDDRRLRRGILHVTVDLPAQIRLALGIEVARIQRGGDLLDCQEWPLVGHGTLSVHDRGPQIKEAIDLLLDYRRRRFDFGNRASASERTNQKKAMNPTIAYGRSRNLKRRIPHSHPGGPGKVTRYRPQTTMIDHQIICAPVDRCSRR